MSMIFEHFASLYEAIIGVWFITKFTKTPMKNIFFVPTIAIIFGISIYFTYNTVFSILHPILSLIIFFIYSFLCKKTNILKNILSPIIFIISLILVDTIIVLIFDNIAHIHITNVVEGNTLVRYLFLILCKISLTIVLSLIIKFFSLEKHFDSIDIITFLFYPVISFLILYIFVEIALKYDISQYTVLVLIVVISIALLNILSAVVLKKLIQNTTAKYELEILSNRSQLEEERYHELGTMYSQLRITRHDIKEHLNYIGYLIDSKKYDEASSYITSKTDELNNTKRVYHTNNRLIDYVIDSKISQNNDIEFTISGTLEKIDNIIDSDLFSLLGNMLNNAIEGANSTESKQIEIEFSINGNYQNIVCKNSINGSVLSKNPEFKTSKKDKSKHGYGIKSMRRIVEKYDGLIDFYEENEKFCVHIALPIKTIEENS